MKLKNLFVKLAATAMAIAIGGAAILATQKEAKPVDATSSLYTTCDFTTKAASHSAYNDSWAYGTPWNVFGGANNNGGWAYVKFGGKNTTLATANPTYVNNVSAMGSAISKVSISLLVGTLPSGTGVNSFGVKVYSDATMATLIDSSYSSSLTKPTAAIVYDFAPSAAYQAANSTIEWPTGSYYKVYFDCTSTSSSNGIIWVDKVQFYKEAAFVAVSSVTIDDPGSSELTVGTTVTLSTTVLPADATDKTVTWSATGTDVVRVLSNGQVIPCNNGSTTITATSVSDGTKYGTHAFTVVGQDLSTSGRTVTTTSLGLLATYVNGYYGSGTVFSLRGVMAKSVNGELQFGNNAAAGQGLMYNVSSLGSKIDSIVVTNGASGATVASALYVGTSVNPSSTIVTPVVNGTVSTYDVSSLGDYGYFSFGLTGTSGTNYYDSIAINLYGDANTYAKGFLSSTDSECSALSVSTATWSSLQSSFGSLSSDAKTAITGVTANSSGTNIQKAIARYNFVVQKYGYTDFMGLGVGGSANEKVLTTENSSSAIAAIAAMLGLAVCGVVLLRRKKQVQ